MNCLRANQRTHTRTVYETEIMLVLLTQRRLLRTNIQIKLPIEIVALIESTEPYASRLRRAGDEMSKLRLAREQGARERVKTAPAVDDNDESARLARGLRLRASGIHSVRGAELTV